MKKLTLILLVVISVQVNAQKYSNELKLIGLELAQITFEAAGDAYFDEGQKELGHMLQVASFGTVMATPYLVDIRKDNWHWHLIGYTLIRAATFDLMYNAFRGLPYNYVGSTSYWDKFLGEINCGDGFLLPRAGFLVVGVSITIRNY